MTEPMDKKFIIRAECREHGHTHTEADAVPEKIRQLRHQLKCNWNQLEHDICIIATAALGAVERHQRVLRDVLMSADVSWEHERGGHDWPAAIAAVRALLSEEPPPERRDPQGDEDDEKLRAKIAAKVLNGGPDLDICEACRDGGSPCGEFRPRRGPDVCVCFHRGLCHPSPERRDQGGLSEDDIGAMQANRDQVQRFVEATDPSARDADEERVLQLCDDLETLIVERDGRLSAPASSAPLFKSPAYVGTSEFLMGTHASGYVEDVAKSRREQPSEGGISEEERATFGSAIKALDRAGGHVIANRIEAFLQRLAVPPSATEQGVTT